MIILMVFLLYNKVLLRILVALSAIGVGLTTWQYLSLSHAKLGQQGMIDAFAIVSFLIAAWMIMLTAEVVDNHYVRAFACLCMLLGCIVSFRWLFVVDGPRLIELPGGAAGMQLITVGFGLALLISVFMLALLVTRLIRDKLHSGRLPAIAGQMDQVLGTVPEGSKHQAAGKAALEPIPLDTSPLGQPAKAAPVEPAEVIPDRIPAPVARLVAIGGLYLGDEHELAAGDHGIGRADASILLDRDNQVSRAHARISVAEDGMAVLSDDGSTNGTFLNNKKIDSSELAPGDVIRIGTTQFRVEGRS